jgi:4-amino-4-deoxy-L-arabinose transferase-like glycosyltransferase
MTSDQWTQYLLRSGTNTPRDIRLDYLWLLGLGLLLIATGIGMRDPWPADEPRFALIARDMVGNGNWLLPRVGGDVYADKPPLFFWLIALGLKATHSLRLAFLLPSLLSALGCVVLVYDLGRRLWNRETGLVAGLSLLITVQFVWQARQAQIDATLCFWTTLSLYGLLRHLLLGPQWRWYAIGWAAAGLGVITKGVGFLPLLVLIPFALLRPPRWSPRATSNASARWLIGPLAFLLAVGAWLVPMLLAARLDPTLTAYRDEILFQQTVDRYAHAWHHHRPFWYFLVHVIPWFWLPLTALLPWLIPRWRKSLREHDLRIALLLAWIGLVILFFSLSSGKRGVYVLPAVPAFALACAPYLAEIARQRTAQRVIFAVAALVSSVFALTVASLLVRADKRAELIGNYEIDPLGPLLLIAVLASLVCAIARPNRGFAAFAGVVAVVLLTVSFWVNPAMNESESGASFVARVERTADPTHELGLVAYKEQYLLNARRPIVHFGHARWREADQEAADAALWLSSRADRQLLVSERVRALCFGQAEAQALGRADRIDWYIVRGHADPGCVARGKPDVARSYVPPWPPLAAEFRSHRPTGLRRARSRAPRIPRQEPGCRDVHAGARSQSHHPRRRTCPFESRVCHRKTSVTCSTCRTRSSASTVRSACRSIAHPAFPIASRCATQSRASRCCWSTSPISRPTTPTGRATPSLSAKVPARPTMPSTRYRRRCAGGRYRCAPSTRSTRWWMRGLPMGPSCSN